MGRTSRHGPRSRCRRGLKTNKLFLFVQIENLLLKFLCLFFQLESVRRGLNYGVRSMRPSSVSNWVAAIRRGQIFLLESKPGRVELSAVLVFS